MIEYFLTIVLIGFLFTVGLWGVLTATIRLKSPPAKMRTYGIYLRICLFVGGLACLAGAALLAKNLFLG